jgi:hypothetical protein
MAIWDIFLAESDSMTIVADITPECRSKSFDLALNRSGSFSFSMPFNSVHKEYFGLGEYCAIVLKNNNIVWSGPLWTREDNFDSGRFEFSAVGWFEILNKRFITDADRTYTTQTDSAIVYDLLAYANAQTDTWIDEGVDTSTASRTITLERWQNIGEQINNFTEMESGLDWEIDPETRDMNLYAWDDFDDQTGVIWGFRRGGQNVSSVVRQNNIEDLANHVYVVGPTQIGSASDATSISTYNRHQKVINISELDNLGVLGAITNAELAVSKDPRVTINFSPIVAEQLVSAYSFFEDFKLRDKIYLSAYRDEVEIDALGIRVFGVGFEIDENNNEKITSLATTYQASG